jgi:hypothetical protein
VHTRTRARRPHPRPAALTAVSMHDDLPQGAATSCPRLARIHHRIPSKQPFFCQLPRTQPDQGFSPSRFAVLWEGRGRRLSSDFALVRIHLLLQLVRQPPGRNRHQHLRQNRRHDFLLSPPPAAKLQPWWHPVSPSQVPPQAPTTNRWGELAATVRTRGVRKTGASDRPIQVTKEKESCSMAVCPPSCAVREAWLIFLLYDFCGNRMRRRRFTYGRIFVERVQEVERKYDRL